LKNAKQKEKRSHFKKNLENVSFFLEKKISLSATTLFRDLLFLSKISNFLKLICIIFCRLLILLKVSELKNTIYSGIITFIYISHGVKYSFFSLIGPCLGLCLGV